ncbi:MAG: hypothetical protein K0M45_09720 [Candidatus Paracaedibacteraceae bacterium]|nr:hypothetical protein [Candidatus Paracaedibacteraceae bacterium]
MKLIILLLCFSAAQASQVKEADLSYPDYSCFKDSQSYFPPASAPAAEEEKINPLVLYYHRLGQPKSWGYTSSLEEKQEEDMPAEQPLFQQQSSKSLEKELARLTKKNKELKNKIDTMSTLLTLLEENNQMLKTLLSTFHAQGVQINSLENGQIQIEDHLITMVQKLKHWKTEMTQSHAHSLMQILKWFKIGFNISTSLGTAVTTYYTIAWFTAVLPSALTPPGWILLTTSATTGALYYIASAV